MHTKNKSNISDLFCDRLSKVDSAFDRKTYYYKNISFSFSGLDYRNPEKLVLYINIKSDDLKANVTEKNSLVCEHYVLKYFSTKINSFNEQYYNKNKGTREKPYVESQVPSSIIIKRNGIKYDEDNSAFTLRLFYSVPLINNVSVNGKSWFKNTKELLIYLSNLIDEFDAESLKEKVKVYYRQ